MSDSHEDHALCIYSVFSLSSTELRGHEFKLQKSQIHLDIRIHFLHSELLMNGMAFQKQL